jgi:hypothetical protein
MGYAIDQQSALDRPSDVLSGTAWNETSSKVYGIDELLLDIMHLQPHEEMDIVVTPEEVQKRNTSDRLGDTEHRGYLMDIELGEIPTICVKRTF